MACRRGKEGVCRLVIRRLRRLGPFQEVMESPWLEMWVLQMEKGVPREVKPVF